MADLIDEDLSAALQRTTERIRVAGVFVCLFDGDLIKDVDALVQLSLAILLDKPIGLLVPKGAHLPRKLEIVAAGAIEFYEPANRTSLQEATSRLMNRLSEQETP